MRAAAAHIHVMDRGRAIRRQRAPDNATLERLVDTQLGALGKALHGARVHARAGIDPSSKHAQMRLAVRLLRASTRLALALACFKPIRHTLTITHIGPDGRILKERTRTWIEERTIALPRLSSRRKEEGGGGTVGI